MTTYDDPPLDSHDGSRRVAEGRVPVFPRCVPRFVFLLAALLLWPEGRLAALELSPSEITLSLTNAGHHTPILVTLIDPPDTDPIDAASDRDWVSPVPDPSNGTIELSFDFDSLLSSQDTATITITANGQTAEVTINAVLRTMEIVRLIDDPFRSRVYGAHRPNGLDPGAVVVFDHLTETYLGQVTVGIAPSGMALGPDGDELFVICGGSGDVHVVDTDKLRVTEIISLPAFETRDHPFVGNVAAGPNRVLYYTDGAEPPLLRVYSRNSGNVFQTHTIAPGDNAGFGHFNISSDRTRLFGWSMSNWTASPTSSRIARFSIGTSGALTHQETQTLPELFFFAITPGANPVLLDEAGTTVLALNEALRAPALERWVNTLPAPAVSMSGNARIAGTIDGLYDVSSGERLHDLNPAASIQTFTSDFSRLVYFHNTSRSLQTHDLKSLLTDEQLGLQTKPADNATVSLPVRLDWVPVPGVGKYRVYFGTSEEDVAAAGPESNLLRGTTHNHTWAQLPNLALGNTYFWRVDALFGHEVDPGPVRRFTVTPIHVGPNALNVETFEHVSAHRQSIRLSHPFIREPEDSPSFNWEAQANRDWIILPESAGTTPFELEIHLDANRAGVGPHRGEIAVSVEGAKPFLIPVELQVKPLEITRIESDPNSDRVYAINQFEKHRGHRAYLLKIDSTTEELVNSRYIAPGASGLAVHPRDERLYVATSPGARVFKLDPASLDTVATFTLAGSTSSTPSLRAVHPGPTGRLLVGYTEPGYRMRVIDTVTGQTVSSAQTIREGRGATSPNGNFYYHGETNRSNAHLRRYSVSADQFTESGSIRVTSVSNFGSSVVAMSHDGSRLFWNGSAITPSLSEEWEVGALIHSASADGRLAAGEELIYDIDAREAILGMPKDTGPSAYNAATGKFVAQSGNRLAFFNPDDPSALAAPELTAATRGDTWVDLDWIDRSLETGFTLEVRTAGSATWNEIASLPRNATAFSVTGLNPETEYAFRLQANAPSGNSDWSEVLELSTTAPPPSTPNLTATAQSAFAVLLQWNASQGHDALIVERRASLDDPWVRIRTLPSGISAYVDEYALEPGVLHFYRIFRERDGLLSEPSATRSTRPDYLSSILTIHISQIFPDAPDSLTLTWNASPRAQWYEIQYRPQGAEDWIPVARVDRPQTLFRHTGLVPGQTYEYRLRAANEEATANFSNIVSATTADWTTVLAENFNGAPDFRNWYRTTGGTVLDGLPGFDRGSALRAGAESVNFQTLSLDTSRGGVVVFDLRAGNAPEDGTQYWNNFSSKSLYVDYSIDGNAWTTLETYPLGYPNFRSWETVVVALPPQARSPATRIRWNVPGTAGQGHWGLTGIRVLADSPDTAPAPAYVLSQLEGESSVALRWPVPHPGGSVTMSHPESLYHFRVERRLPGGDWQAIGIAPGAAEPSFLDTTAPAFGTVFYRVVTVRPWTESRPSLATTLYLGTQLEAWRQAHYGTMENSGVAADLARDAFGLTNLTRYAFGLGTGTAAATHWPGTPTPGLPAIWLDPETGLLHVAFLRRKPSTYPDIEYITEYTGDFDQWIHSVGPHTITAVNDLWEEVRYVQPNTLDPASSVFARVKVRRLPQ